MGNTQSEEFEPDMEVIMSYVDKDDIEVFSYIKNNTKKVDHYYEFILKYNVFAKKGINVFKHIFDSDPDSMMVYRAIKLYRNNENFINVLYKRNKELFDSKLNIVINCIACDVDEEQLGGILFHRLFSFDNFVKLGPEFTKRIIDRNPILINLKTKYRTDTTFQCILNEEWFELGYYCLEKYSYVFNNNCKEPINIIDILDNNLRYHYWMSYFRENALSRNTEKNINLLCCCRSFSEDSILHNNYLPRDMFNLIIKSIENERRRISFRYARQFNRNDINIVKYLMFASRVHYEFKKLPKNVFDKILTYVLGWKF